jgi:hypothetical protein
VTVASRVDAVDVNDTVAPSAPFDTRYQTVMPLARPSSTSSVQPANALNDATTEPRFMMTTIRLPETSDAGRLTLCVVEAVAVADSLRETTAGDAIRCT